MKNIKTAIIGGSGLSQLKNLRKVQRKVGRTPYGDPSAPMTLGLIGDGDDDDDALVVFLPRHGLSHEIPPHKVNYRANIWALKSLGVERIFAVGATGSIAPDMQAQDIVIPDQIIDYTYGRDHTFFDGSDVLNAGSMTRHIDFSEPYSEPLRQALIQASEKAGLKVHKIGVYAATQGPRLETAAEINRIEQDGGSIVGMTGMPEAALARELEMDYALISLVVNPAAGRGDAREISIEEINTHLKDGMEKVRRVFELMLET